MAHKFNLFGVNDLGEMVLTDEAKAIRKAMENEAHKPTTEANGHETAKRLSVHQSIREYHDAAKIKEFSGTRMQAAAAITALMKAK